MDKKKQYKTLDDIGFVGVQVKQTAKSNRYHEKRTAEVLRAYRMGLIDSKKSLTVKKVGQ